MNKNTDFPYAHSIFGKDLLSGSDRFQRLAWLAKEIPVQDLYQVQDTGYSKLLFNEISECYINGQFIATIVLGFSFIEREIAGRLFSIGDKKTAEKGKSEELINSAHKKGWLTEDEMTRLNKLRDLRNPVVHFRDPFNFSHPDIAAILKAQTTPKCLEENSKLILGAIIHILNKTAL